MRSRFLMAAVSQLRDEAVGLAEWRSPMAGWLEKFAKPVRGDAVGAGVVGDDLLCGGTKLRKGL